MRVQMPSQLGHSILNFQNSKILTFESTLGLIEIFKVFRSINKIGFKINAHVGETLGFQAIREGFYHSRCLCI